MGFFGTLNLITGKRFLFPLVLYFYSLFIKNRYSICSLYVSLYWTGGVPLLDRVGVSLLDSHLLEIGYKNSGLTRYFFESKV